MTEEEMKKTWCPHARIACVIGGEGIQPDITSFNTTAIGIPKAAMCLGSSCSQWRWERVQNYNDSIPAYVFSKTSGYCGLAGRP